MDVELLGGALDGKRFHLAKKDSAAISLRFQNPVPITFCSNLCAPKVFGRLQYNRSYVKEGTIFYTFHGYIE